MKKLITVMLTIIFIFMVVFSTCFSLGMFDNEEAVPVFNEIYGTFTYYGETQGSRFDGGGEIIFNNGGRYSGGFSGGRFDGAGQYYNTEDWENDGWRFEGNFQNGQALSGTFESAGNQIFQFERGEKADSVISPHWRFDGNFNANGQNGEGKFTFADGSVYIGNFRQGLAEGLGSYTDALGVPIYSGHFKQGLFEGRGIYRHPDGWVYEGDFHMGLFDGEGAVTINGEVVWGEWEKGKQIKRHE